MQKFAGTLVFLLAIGVVDVHAQSLRELGIEETTWRSKMASGAPLEIFGGVGDITVVRSETDEATVTIVRGTEGTVSPRVILADSPTRLRICADWITPAGAPSPCGTTKKRLVKNSEKGYVSLGLHVAVPDGVDVKVLNSSGNITVAPRAGSVRAETYRGDVTVSSTGPRMYAYNHDGRITLDLVPELIKQNVHVSTIRGQIHVSLPESRLVNLFVYSRGVAVRSDYNLGEGGVLRDGVYQYKGAGTLHSHHGPPKSKTWTQLEIFAGDDIYSSIAIVKP